MTQVRIPRADLDAYASQRGKTRGGASAPLPADGPPAPAARPQGRGQAIWKQVASEQAQEILELRVRIRELEGELDARRR